MTEFPTKIHRRFPLCRYPVSLGSVVDLRCRDHSDAHSARARARRDRDGGRRSAHLARKVDALVEAYGNYVGANAPGIDRSLFKDVLFNALDGNALYEIEQASQQLRDDNAERAYYARHNPSAAE